MKYSTNQIKEFQETVCPNCTRCNRLNPASCPKLFNFVLYGTKDGSCPETSAMLKSQKK